MNGTKQLSPCGTEAAYRRARRLGVKACAACLRAHREYERARYQERTVRAA